MNTQAPALFPTLAPAAPPPGWLATLRYLWAAWRAQRALRDVPTAVLRREGLLPDEQPDPHDVAADWLGGRLRR